MDGDVVGGPSTGLICWQHELVFHDNPHDGLFCNFCGLIISPSGPYYRCTRFCSSSNFHKSCFHPPNQIQHPFHPQHPLFLRAAGLRRDPSISCKACGNNHCFRFYHCPLCSFDLDSRCAKLVPLKIGGGGGEAHPHPLFLCEIDDGESYNYPCSYCTLNLRGQIYACLDCNILIHTSCSELGRKINHPFHPSHPLFLLPAAGDVKCSVCRVYLKGFVYQCRDDCGFFMDIQCASLMPIGEEGKGGSDPIVQLSHSHPLTLCHYNSQNFNKICYGCSQHIMAVDLNPICFCSQCKVLLHKSCAESAIEIKHPFDSLHPLTLVDFDNPNDFYDCRRCKSCHVNFKGFSYRCSACELEIDLKCALSKPASMMSENHHHPLVLFNEKTPEPIGLIDCSKCNRLCHMPFFRCLLCALDIHVNCLPKLPTTIKSDHHLHSLSLTFSPIKYLPFEDENAELYCDNCEELRILNDPSYSCEECHFVSHIHCMITEVMRLLEEEWGLALKVGEAKLETFPEEVEGGIDQVLMKNECEKENAASSAIEILGCPYPTPMKREATAKSLLVRIDERLAMLHAEKDSLKQRLKEIDKIILQLEAQRALNDAFTQ